jgi:hypothetical protein
MTWSIRVPIRWPTYSRTGQKETGYRYVAKATLPAKVGESTVMRDVQATIWKEPKKPHHHSHVRLWSYSLHYLNADGSEGDFIEQETFSCSTMTEVKQLVKSLLSQGVH